MAYYKNNQTPDAKEYLKKALEMNSGFDGAEEARRVLKEIGNN
jgi:hypothetical protein